MIRDAKGQILPLVMISLAILCLVAGALIVWTQNDAKWSVKAQRSASAVNFAEAAVDRACWKLQSSTITWAAASAGTAIPGYAFDTTYRDIPGGEYRIQFSTGPNPDQITIRGEGRDFATSETRALVVIVQNQTIPGAILSGGTLRDTGAAITHWGPLVAQGDITVAGTSLNRHYPRKLSKQVVHPFDTNGLTPPNTDNLEWWSDYGTPALPILDFAALRASAQATNTLNCNGNYSNTTHQVPCGSNCVNCSVNNIYKDNRFDSGYVWYWDNNVTLNNTGLRGTVIVRGDMSTQGGDWYGPYGPLNHTVTMHMPEDAWQEYQKIDTAAINEYPGDMGFHSSANAYVLGSCSASCEGSPTGDDLGFYGFVYVGGDASFQGDSDIYGAVWVVGNWSAAGNNVIFYDDRLQLPALNVVLIRKHWQEVAPSAQAWL